MSKTKETPHSWTKHWSSRGTHLLNLVETYSTHPKNYSGYSKQRGLKDSPNYMAQLQFLLKKNPNNEFYKSLKEQSRNRSLTQKQKDCIAKDFASISKTAA